MGRWHYRLSGRELEQTPRDRGGQQSMELQRARHDLVTKQQKDRYLFQWYGLTHGICTLMLLWVKLKESNTLNLSIILQSF